jgi:fluoride ion exporter CrcB/FEX
VVRPPFPSPLLRVLAVLAGGLAGGAIRYVATVLTDHSSPLSASLAVRSQIDLRLLAVNSVGVFVASWLLLGPLAQRSPDDPWRLFCTTGLLGGLTTYSSLVVSVGYLWRANPAVAVLEMLVSLTMGLGAALVGRAVARAGKSL